MTKIIIVADLDLGPSFSESDVKQFILDNLSCWVSMVISRDTDSSYGLSDPTVYYGLEDFDADRAEGLDHFAS